VTIRLAAEAEADLTDAYAWYRDRGQSVASDFLTSLESVLETLEHHPESFPEVHNRVRRALMRRFPYAVFYVLGVGGPWSSVSFMRAVIQRSGSGAQAPNKPLGRQKLICTDPV